jgi:hypothetical protein
MSTTGPNPEGKEKVIVSVPQAWILRQIEAYHNNWNDKGRAANLRAHLNHHASTDVFEYQGIPPNFPRKFYVVLDEDQEAVEWLLKHSS